VDYFSVTGGDYHRGGNHRSTFRMDNYDDGSTVETYQGRVSVLHIRTPRTLKRPIPRHQSGDDSS